MPNAHATFLLWLGRGALLTLGLLLSAATANAAERSDALRLDQATPGTELRLLAQTTTSENPMRPNQLDELADKILYTEIELQKINAHVHLEAANPSFARSRRTWLWDVGNALPTEAGLIDATVLFYGHSNDKIVDDIQVKDENGKATVEAQKKRVHYRVPRSKLAGSIIPQIAGQVVGGTGSLYELSVDYKRYRKLHKHELDGRAVTRRVVALKNEIDSLQAQFDRLTQAGVDRSYVLEGKLLKEIRDKTLLEFIRIEKAGALLAVGRVVEDAVSFTRNTVGTVGNSINVGAIYAQNKRLNGEGAILNLIAASMISTRPFISNAAALVATKHSIAKMHRYFPELADTKNISCAAELSQLQQTGASSTSAQANRLALYSRQMANFSDTDDLAQKESQKAKQIVVRRFRESIYGPTKMAQSIMNIVIGFRKANNVTADNRLDATANMTYTSGQVFNIMELVRERVVDEAAHSKLKSAQMLPEQRIQRSLKDLEVMQTQLHL